MRLPPLNAGYAACSPVDHGSGSGPDQIPRGEQLMNGTRLGRTRVLRVAAATAAAAALAGSVQLVTASSASAAVSRVVQGHSVSHATTARKVAVASCPLGTRDLGG